MSDDISQDHDDWSFGHAYGLLVSALQCAIRWIETSTLINGVTGATLEAQATALARGWTPTRRWAQAVAAAIYLADQLVMPLRPGESVRLKTRERTHSADYSSVRIRMRRPKTGHLVAFQYHDGNPGVYPVALYKLYVMKGGARDILLSSGGDDVPPCNTFYVPRGGGASRLDFGALGRMLAWCLHLAEIDIGLTDGLLRQAGLARPGSVRIIVACHIIARRGLDETASLLGLSPQMVAMRYLSHLATRR